jgi:hypothetical protein
MGNKFWEVVCDEHGIGGSGEYSGSKDSHHHGRINVLYHEALGGKYVPRAVFLYLEPGLIGAVALSRRSANSSAREPREPHSTRSYYTARAIYDENTCNSTC